MEIASPSWNTVLAGKDTVHQRFEKVSYIVGSGQHTNSHIININGYLHQAPITFYTQKGKWDLSTWI
jgi:hypothetical protein